MATSPASSNGLLLVDKPAGMTSHDVVGKVRRAFHTKRVGHAGTLDPFATGLLVCALGQSTRLLPYLDSEPKVYRADIAFGTATDTDDSAGAPIATGPAPNWELLDVALASLTGTIAQTPPSYSAKHVDGKRAYALARRGELVQLEPVSITVHSWRVIERTAQALAVEICCAGGTYIRALARDLGRALGTVAHCATLRRLQSGVHAVGDAVSVSSLLEAPCPPLTSPLGALTSLATQPLSETDMVALRFGRQFAATVAGARAALVAADGTVVGVAERVVAADGDRWQPKVVLLDVEGATC